jgi:hypothetical protein
VCPKLSKESRNHPPDPSDEKYGDHDFSAYGENEHNNCPESKEFLRRVKSSKISASSRQPNPPTAVAIPSKNHSHHAISNVFFLAFLALLQFFLFQKIIFETLNDGAHYRISHASSAVQSGHYQIGSELDRLYSLSDGSPVKMHVFGRVILSRCTISRLYCCRRCATLWQPSGVERN